MIEVTRINGTKISINPFLIEYLEETPDTVILFNSGHKMVVKEKKAVIQEMILEFIGGAIRRGVQPAP